MRIIVYGFGPYGEFKNNVTERVVRGLLNRRRPKKIVFPVKFHRNKFIKAVKDTNPDIVLGLGQCSGGNRLRIETRAVNGRRDRKQGKPRRIIPRGSQRLMTGLRLVVGGKARSSSDAGQYVCNYSMYVILDFLTRRRSHARFGFIHIPHRTDAARACRCW